MKQDCQQFIRCSKQFCWTSFVMLSILFTILTKDTYKDLNFNVQGVGYNMLLTCSGRSTHIRALEGEVEVAKVHIFVQSGI
jgi:hypothetical protein